MTLPVPEAAMSKNTRFRWVEKGSSTEQNRWAIDNIYIGDDQQCPGWCTGRGKCTSSGCQYVRYCLSCTFYKLFFS